MPTHFSVEPILTTVKSTDRSLGNAITPLCLPRGRHPPPRRPWLGKRHHPAQVQANPMDADTQTERSNVSSVRRRERDVGAGATPTRQKKA